MPRYVYVLKSLKDGNFYKGYTKDLKKRFEDHNKGKVESTKLRIPFELIYYEACRNEEDALHREKYSPREIQDIIHQQVLEI